MQNKKHYKEFLSFCTYPKAGGLGLSSKKMKDINNEIRKAVEDESEEILWKVFNKSALSGFEKNKIRDIIEETKEAMENPIVEIPQLDVNEAMEFAGYTVVLGMYDGKTAYYIRDNERTGENRSFSIFGRAGDKDLLRLAININKDEDIKVVSSFDSIQVAITSFNPAEEAIFLKEKNVYFNTWTAPELACIPHDAPRMEQPEKYHLLHTLLMNIVGYDEKAYNYLMNALAKSYQSKDYLINIIALTGIQGTGKQILFNLLTAIFTEAHVGKGDGKHNIFRDSDNTNLKDKLIYVLDETPIGGEYYENAKAVAGNSNFTWKSLNQNSINYPNRSLMLNFFNLTHDDEIKFPIADGDRRITVIDSHTQLIDAEYFRDYRNLDDAVRNFKLESKSGLVEYFAWMLATWNIDESLIERPLDNEIRRKWMEAGKDHTEDFYNAVLNRDISYFEKHADGMYLIENGYRNGIVNTVQRMFDVNASFQLRVLTLSTMFKEIFKKDENKKARDRIMEGLRTRAAGKGGEFIYVLPTQERSTPGMEVKLDGESQREAISSALGSFGDLEALGIAPLIPKDFR